MSLPTDCDSRDERKGWTGDASVTCDEAHHNFEMGAHYTNFLRNLHDAQLEDGAIPDTVPYVPPFGMPKGDPSKTILLFTIEYY